jgi:uncharacterized protein (DUF2252 family)
MPPASELRTNLIRAELRRVDGIDPAAAPSGKHWKMSANPARFLRGSSQLFYTDIVQGTLELPRPLLEKPPLTTIMGDCHVSNFGFITEQGSHGDRVVFCPNDYDDACVGPAVWDLSRFLVSLLLTADYCRGILSADYCSGEIGDLAGLQAASAEDALDAANEFLGAYRRTCRQSVLDPDRHMSALDHFPRKHVLGGLLRKARRRAAGGKDFETKSTLGKDVEVDDGRPRFRSRPERFALLDPGRAEAVRQAFRPYVDDDVLDLVQRLGAGTGSVNLERFYLLVGPEPFSGADDLPLCHVVEVKQQRPAAALYHFPDLSPVNRLNPAHLTVDCQRLMQRSPDLVLDEALWEGNHWLIRSRHHARVGVDPEDVALAEKKPGKRLAQYAAACGEALALAHARGDRRSHRFEAAMTAHLKAEAGPLIAAARNYAERVKDDWSLLRALLGQSHPHRD